MSNDRLRIPVKSSITRDMQDGSDHGLFRRWWGFLTRAPDDFMLEVGVYGEILVARARLMICGLLEIVPIVFLLYGSGEEITVALVGNTSALIYAIIIYQVVKRGYRNFSLRLFTTVVDISLVSLGLFSFAVASDPSIAANSRVIHEIYLLLIALTALRADYRLCIIAGLVAIIQYVAILLYIIMVKDMMSLPHEALAYGGFSIADQISRVVVMLIMTILAVILVVRNMNLIQLSSVDPLTGLFNRNYFNVRFKQESYRSQRQEYALSVIMLDLDHFKQINDEYGHLIGDHVLRVIAGQLQDLCRASDVVSRFGGEEFVIIMPDSDYVQTLARAEQIRKHIETHEFDHPNADAVINLTVSLGVATIPDDASSVEDSIRIADERLIRAKRAGRNRVFGSEVADEHER